MKESKSLPPGWRRSMRTENGSGELMREFIFEVRGNTAELTAYVGKAAEVELPNRYGGFRVEAIGAEAFRNHGGMVQLKIPEGVRRIGKQAFYGCSSLCTVELPTSIETIESSAFCRCAALRRITIPGGVKKVGLSAFYGCSALMQVEIGEGTEELESWAFYGCTALKEIRLPESLWHAGFHCVGKTALCVGNGYTVADGILLAEYDGGAEEAVVPEGVRILADGVFSGQTKIKRVCLPDRLMHIGKKAFYGCTGLRSAELLPGLKTVGESAFCGCTELTAVHMPDSVERIGKNAFCGCEKLREATLPKAVSLLPDSVFRACKSLFRADLPKHVRRIGESAYEGCESLQSVRLPEALRSMGKYAFYGCGNLPAIALPPSLTQIGRAAFGKCVALKEIGIRTALPAGDLLGPGESTVVCGADSGGAPLFRAVYFADAVFFSSPAAKRKFAVCIDGDAHFRFAGYDAAWEGICGEHKVGVSILRLLYPYDLTEACKKNYLNFLRINAAEAVRWCAAENSIEGLCMLCEKDIFTKQTVSAAIEWTSRMERPEMTARLLAYKSDTFGVTLFDEMFDLDEL